MQNYVASLRYLGFVLLFMFGVAQHVQGEASGKVTSPKSLYQELRDRAKVHQWQVLGLGYQHIWMFDFDLHKPMTVFQIHRSASGSYEVELGEATVSPDSAWIAVGLERPPTVPKTTTLVLLNVASQKTEPLKETGRIYGICWSPDGKKIVYVSSVDRDSTYEMHLLDLETRKDEIILHGGLYEVTTQSWSPDGQYLAYAFTKERSDYHAIMIYDFMLRRSRELVKRGRRPTWSPTGEWIAYGALDESETHAIFQLVSPDGQRQAPVLKEPRFAPNAIATATLWSPDGAYLLYERIYPENPEGRIPYLLEIATNREESLPLQLLGFYAWSEKP